MDLDSGRGVWAVGSDCHGLQTGFVAYYCYYYCWSVLPELPFSFLSVKKAIIYVLQVYVWYT